jgi:hypothetical protein
MGLGGRSRWRIYPLRDPTGRSALKAKQTLEALRDLIDETLRDIDLYEKMSLSERRGRRGAMADLQAAGS